jgi:hypothetical protein
VRAKIEISLINEREPSTAGMSGMDIDAAAANPGARSEGEVAGGTASKSYRGMSLIFLLYNGDDTSKPTAPQIPYRPVMVQDTRKGASLRDILCQEKSAFVWTRDVGILYESLNHSFEPKTHTESRG